MSGKEEGQESGASGAAGGDQPEGSDFAVNAAKDATALAEESQDSAGKEPLSEGMQVDSDCKVKEDGDEEDYNVARSETGEINDDTNENDEVKGGDEDANSDEEDSGSESEDSSDDDSDNDDENGLSEYEK